MIPLRRLLIATAIVMLAAVSFLSVLRIPGFGLVPLVNRYNSLLDRGNYVEAYLFAWTAKLLYPRSEVAAFLVLQSQEIGKLGVAQNIEPTDAEPCHPFPDADAWQRLTRTTKIEGKPES